MFNFPFKTHTGNFAVLHGNIILGKTYNGNTVNLPLDQCIGIQCDRLDFRQSDDTCDTRIMIVSKNFHTWKSFLPWCILVLLHVFLGTCIAYCVGPISSFLTICFFVFQHIHNRNGQVSNIFIFLCTSFLFYVLTNLVEISIGIVTCLIFINQISNLSFKIPDRAQMSYVFEFHRNDYKMYDELRQVILESQYKYLICDPWLANRYVEYILSWLLPDFIYNNLKIRRFLQKSVDFIFPILMVIQGLSIIVPWLTENFGILLQLSKADIGLKIVIQFILPKLIDLYQYIYTSQLVVYFGNMISKIQFLLAPLQKFQIFILNLHYYIVYIASQIPIAELYQFFSRIFSFTFIEPIVTVLKHVMNILKFGRRTPEHIVFLTKRIGETSKIIYDRCWVVKKNLKNSNKKHVTPLLAPTSVHLDKIPPLSL